MDFTSVHMLEVKPQVMMFSISVLTQLHNTRTAYHNQENVQPWISKELSPGTNNV